MSATESMEDANPYSAPDADLGGHAQETYDPKFLAVSGRIGRLRYLAYSIGITFLFLSHQRLGRARKESQGYGSRDPWRHMLPHHSHLHSILPSRPRTA